MYIHTYIHKYMHRFIYSDLIVPLVRANFYVTENEASKHKLTWYRKVVWARVRANAILSSTYTELSSGQTLVRVMNECMYICMYVCMYV
jgi:hypothetical protein